MSAAGRQTRSGWHWFTLWAVAGTLTTLGVLGGLGYGSIAVVPASFLLVLLIFRSRLWPEAIGLGAGTALFVIYMGIGSGAYPPCPEDRKSTRLNSSHIQKSRMPSSA